MAGERIVVSVDPKTNALLEEMINRQDFYDKLLINNSTNHVVNIVSSVYPLDDSNELEMDFYSTDSLALTDLFAWQVVDEKDNILYPPGPIETNPYATISPWPQLIDTIRKN